MKTRGRPKGTASKSKKTFGPLGDLIRKSRIEQRLGLAELAEACRCSVQFISNIQHGRAPLPWSKAPALAKVLNIPLSELQTANLAIRSEFIEFIGNSGRKVKNSDAFKNFNEISASLKMISSDPSLQEIFKKYQEASTESRKKFTSSALDLFI